MLQKWASYLIAIKQSITALPFLALFGTRATCGAGPRYPDKRTLLLVDGPQGLIAGRRGTPPRASRPPSLPVEEWTSVAQLNHPSRLLQKLRAQHQALDLVGAAFDLVSVVGEMNTPDHGAALQHGGRALQLQVLDQRDAVALGEQRAVGIPDLDVHVMLSARRALDGAGCAGVI